MSLEKPEDKSIYFSDEKWIISKLNAMEVVTTEKMEKRKSRMFSEIK